MEASYLAQFAAAFARLDDNKASAVLDRFLAVCPAPFVAPAGTERGGVRLSEADRSAVLTLIRCYAQRPYEARRLAALIPRYLDLLWHLAPSPDNDAFAYGMVAGVLAIPEARHLTADIAGRVIGVFERYATSRAAGAVFAAFVQQQQQRGSGGGTTSSTAAARAQLAPLLGALAAVSDKEDAVATLFTARERARLGLALLQILTRIGLASAGASGAVDDAAAAAGGGASGAADGLAGAGAGTPLPPEAAQLKALLLLAARACVAPASAANARDASATASTTAAAPATGADATASGSSVVVAFANPLHGAASSGAAASAGTGDDEVLLMTTTRKLLLLVEGDLAAAVDAQAAAVAGAKGSRSGGGSGGTADPATASGIFGVGEPPTTPHGGGGTGSGSGPYQPEPLLVAACVELAARVVVTSIPRARPRVTGMLLHLLRGTTAAMQARCNSCVSHAASAAGGPSDASVSRAQAALGGYQLLLDTLLTALLAIAAAPPAAPQPTPLQAATAGGGGGSGAAPAVASAAAAAPPTSAVGMIASVAGGRFGGVLRGGRTRKTTADAAAAGATATAATLAAVVDGGEEETEASDVEDHTAATGNDGEPTTPTGRHRGGASAAASSVWGSPQAPPRPPAAVAAAGGSGGAAGSSSSGASLHHRVDPMQVGMLLETAREALANMYASAAAADGAALVTGGAASGVGIAGSGSGGGGGRSLAGSLAGRLQRRSLMPGDSRSISGVRGASAAAAGGGGGGGGGAGSTGGGGAARFARLRLSSAPNITQRGGAAVVAAAGAAPAPASGAGGRSSAHYHSLSRPSHHDVVLQPPASGAAAALHAAAEAARAAARASIVGAMCAAMSLELTPCRAAAAATAAAAASTSSQQQLSQRLVAPLLSPMEQPGSYHHHDHHRWALQSPGGMPVGSVVGSPLHLAAQHDAVVAAAFDCALPPLAAAAAAAAAHASRRVDSTSDAAVLLHFPSASAAGGSGGGSGAVGTGRGGSFDAAADGLPLGDAEGGGEATGGRASASRHPGGGAGPSGGGGGVSIVVFEGTASRTALYALATDLQASLANARNETLACARAAAAAGLLAPLSVPGMGTHRDSLGLPGIPVVGAAASGGGSGSALAFVAAAQRAERLWQRVNHAARLLVHVAGACEHPAVSKVVVNALLEAFTGDREWLSAASALGSAGGAGGAGEGIAAAVLSSASSSHGATSAASAAASTPLAIINQCTRSRTVAAAAAAAAAAKSAAARGSGAGSDASGALSGRGTLARLFSIGTGGVPAAGAPAPTAARLPAAAAAAPPIPPGSNGGIAALVMAQPTADDEDLQMAAAGACLAAYAGAAQAVTNGLASLAASLACSASVYSSILDTTVAGYTTLTSAVGAAAPSVVGSIASSGPLAMVTVGWSSLLPQTLCGIALAVQATAAEVTTVARAAASATAGVCPRPVRKAWQAESTAWEARRSDLRSRLLALSSQLSHEVGKRSSVSAAVPTSAMGGVAAFLGARPAATAALVDVARFTGNAGQLARLLPALAHALQPTPRLQPSLVRCVAGVALLSALAAATSAASVPPAVPSGAPLAASPSALGSRRGVSGRSFAQASSLGSPSAATMMLSPTGATPLAASLLRTGGISSGGVPPPARFPPLALYTAPSAATAGGTGKLESALASASLPAYATPELSTAAGIRIYRSLWFFFVLARLTEPQARLWPSAVYRSVKAIAVQTPALVVRAGAAYFDADLSSSVMLKMPLTDSTIASYRETLASLMPVDMRDVIAALPHPHLVFARCVLALETLRASTGTCKAIFLYIGDSSVEHEGLGGLMAAVCDVVFRVFVARMVRQGRCDASEETLRDHALFLLSHCAHRYPRVRTASFRYLVALLDRFPQLLWNERCIAALLDTVETLAARAARGQAAPPFVPPTPGGAAAASAVGGLSMKPAGADPMGESLPVPLRSSPYPLCAPASQSELADITSDVTELACHWMLRAVVAAPAETRAAFTTYIARLSGVHRQHSHARHGRPGVAGARRPASEPPATAGAAVRHDARAGLTASTGIGVGLHALAPSASTLGTGGGATAIRPYGMFQRLRAAAGALVAAPAGPRGAGGPAGTRVRYAGVGTTAAGSTTVPASGGADGAPGYAASGGAGGAVAAGGADSASDAAAAAAASAPGQLVAASSPGGFTAAFASVGSAAQPLLGGFHASQWAGSTLAGIMMADGAPGAAVSQDGRAGGAVAAAAALAAASGVDDVDSDTASVATHRTRVSGIYGGGGGAGGARSGIPSSASLALAYGSGSASVPLTGASALEQAAVLAAFGLSTGGANDLSAGVVGLSGGTAGGLSSGIRMGVDPLALLSSRLAPAFTTQLHRRAFFTGQIVGMAKFHAADHSGSMRSGQGFAHVMHASQTATLATLMAVAHHRWRGAYMASMSGVSSRSPLDDGELTLTASQAAAMLTSDAINDVIGVLPAEAVPALAHEVTGSSGGATGSGGAGGRSTSLRFKRTSDGGLLIYGADSCSSEGEDDDDMIVGGAAAAPASGDEEGGEDVMLTSRDGTAAASLVPFRHQQAAQPAAGSLKKHFLSLPPSLRLNKPSTASGAAGNASDGIAHPQPAQRRRLVFGSSSRRSGSGSRATSSSVHDASPLPGAAMGGSDAAVASTQSVGRSSMLGGLLQPSGRAGRAAASLTRLFGRRAGEEPASAGTGKGDAGAPQRRSRAAGVSATATARGRSATAATSVLGSPLTAASGATTAASSAGGVLPSPVAHALSSWHRVVRERAAMQADLESHIEEALFRAAAFICWLCDGAGLGSSSAEGSGAGAGGKPTHASGAHGHHHDHTAEAGGSAAAACMRTVRDLLPLVVWLPVRAFTPAALTVAVECWSWLCSYPCLRGPLLSEVAAAWGWTVRMRFGLFSGDASARALDAKQHATQPPAAAAAGNVVPLASDVRPLPRDILSPPDAAHGHATAEARSKHVIGGAGQYAPPPRLPADLCSDEPHRIMIAFWEERFRTGRSRAGDELATIVQAVNVSVEDASRLSTAPASLGTRLRLIHLGYTLLHAVHSPDINTANAALLSQSHAQGARWKPGHVTSAAGIGRAGSAGDLSAVSVRPYGLSFGSVGAWNGTVPGRDDALEAYACNADEATIGSWGCVGALLPGLPVGESGALFETSPWGTGNAGGDGMAGAGVVGSDGAGSDIDAMSSFRGDSASAHDGRRASVSSSSGRWWAGALADDGGAPTAAASAAAAGAAAAAAASSTVHSKAWPAVAAGSLKLLRERLLRATLTWFELPATFYEVHTSSGRVEDDWPYLVALVRLLRADSRLLVLSSASAIEASGLQAGVSAGTAAGAGATASRYEALAPVPETSESTPTALPLVPSASSLGAGGPATGVAGLRRNRSGGASAASSGVPPAASPLSSSGSGRDLRRLVFGRLAASSTASAATIGLGGTAVGLGSTAVGGSPLVGGAMGGAGAAPGSPFSLLARPASGTFSFAPLDSFDPYAPSTTPGAGMAGRRSSFAAAAATMSAHASRYAADVHARTPLAYHPHRIPLQREASDSMDAGGASGGGGPAFAPAPTFAMQQSVAPSIDGYAAGAATSGACAAREMIDLTITLLGHEADRMIAWHNPNDAEERRLPDEREVSLDAQSAAASAGGAAAPGTAVGTGGVYGADRATWGRWTAIAWAVSPPLAVRLWLRFRRRRDITAALQQLVLSDPAAVRWMPEALDLLCTPENVALSVPQLRHLLLWAPVSMPTVVTLLSRCSHDDASLPQPRAIPMFAHPTVAAFVVRCLRRFSPETIVFYLPQLVQALRHDTTGQLADFLFAVSQTSMLVAHQLVWVLVSESQPDTGDKHAHKPVPIKEGSAEFVSELRIGAGDAPGGSGAAGGVDGTGASASGGAGAASGADSSALAAINHGFQRQLRGADALPTKSTALAQRIITTFPPTARALFELQYSFWDSVTNISGRLKTEVVDASQRRAKVKAFLKDLQHAAERDALVARTRIYRHAKHELKELSKAAADGDAAAAETAGAEAAGAGGSAAGAAAGGPSAAAVADPAISGTVTTSAGAAGALTSITSPGAAKRSVPLAGAVGVLGGKVDISLYSTSAPGKGISSLSTLQPPGSDLVRMDSNGSADVGGEDAIASGVSGTIAATGGTIGSAASARATAGRSDGTSPATGAGATASGGGPDAAAGAAGGGGIIPLASMDSIASGSASASPPAMSPTGEHASPTAVGGAGIVSSISGGSHHLQESGSLQAALAPAEIIEEMPDIIDVVYLPTAPHLRVVSVDLDSGRPMQSAAKCPFLLSFDVVPYEGPDSTLRKQERREERRRREQARMSSHARSAAIAKALRLRKKTSTMTKARVAAQHAASVVRRTVQLQRVQLGVTFERTRNSVARGLSRRRKEVTESVASVARSLGLVGGEGGRADAGAAGAAGPSGMTLLRGGGGDGYSSAGSRPSSRGTQSTVGGDHDDLDHDDGLGTSMIGIDESAYADAEDARGVSDPESDHDDFVVPADVSGTGAALAGAGVPVPSSRPAAASAAGMTTSRSALSKLTLGRMGGASKRRAGDEGTGAAAGPGMRSRFALLPAYGSRKRGTAGAPAPLYGAPSAGPTNASAMRMLRTACIFKVYDDCRQDTLVMQVVQLCKHVYEMCDLGLALYPYKVLPTRTGKAKIPGGILEVVPDVRSRDEIGKAGFSTLYDYFTATFGRPDSREFETARRNMTRSLAAYSVICYLMWIKDRHNGNLLVTSTGSIVHIDFGFILGITPGGNLGFETAAFKLTTEMLNIMGGSVETESFAYFSELTCRAYLLAREHMDAIHSLVGGMADSGLPCYLFPDTLQKFWQRFRPDDNEIQACKHMRNETLAAATNMRTVLYDGIQKLQNNIHSEAWQ